MVLEWIIFHWVDIVQIYFGIVGVASVIIKLTPTVRDDYWLKKLLQFTGKFISLNRK